MRIPVEKDGLDEYLKAASQRLNNSESDVKFVKILRKPLDTSCKDQFYYEVSIVVTTPDLFDNMENLPVYTESIEEIKADRKPKNIKDRPVIAGFGPAGMFVALELIDYGIKPMIFERGKQIEERTIDVQRFGSSGFSMGTCLTRHSENISQS